MFVYLIMVLELIWELKTQQYAQIKISIKTLIKKYLSRNYKNENAGYSVSYQENMKKIRMEKVTVKQVIL